MKSGSLLWSEEQGSRQFVRTTVRALGHDEAFLEARIAENPAILGLESLQSGIRGPFLALRQSSLGTPTSRVIYPDILLVSASAHLIAIEVKLEDNPELLNRSVVAQVVEYAASLSALDAEALAALLSDSTEDASLAELAASWFADCEDPHEFANVLASRAHRGEVDLVIACDRCPPGLDDLGSALDRQSALAFRLQVIEVAPWVASDAGHGDQILFLNRPRLRTEIVARTQVLVSWDRAGGRPEVTVNTTSPEDVEDALDAARSNRPQTRHWTKTEIREAILDDEQTPTELQPILIELLDFAIAESFEGRITQQKTAYACFGFRAPHTGGASPNASRQVWAAATYERALWVSTSSLDALLTPDLAEEAKAKFANVVSPPRTSGKEYTMLPLKLIGENMEAFKSLSVWVRDAATAGGVARERQ